VAGFPPHTELRATISIPQTDTALDYAIRGTADAQGSAVLTFAMPDAGALIRDPASPCLAVVVGNTLAYPDYRSAAGIFAYGP